MSKSSIKDRIASLRQKLKDFEGSAEAASIQKQIDELEADFNKQEKNEDEKDVVQEKSATENLPEEKPQEENSQQNLTVILEINHIQELLNDDFKKGNIYALDDKNKKIPNFSLKSGEDAPKNFRSIEMKPKEVRQENISGKLMAIILRFKNLGFVVKEDLSNDDGASFCGVLFPSGYDGNKNILTMSEAQIQQALGHLKDEPNPELKKQEKHNIFCFSFRTVPEYALKQNFDLNQRTRVKLENWEKELNEAAQKKQEAKQLKSSEIEAAI
jgi:hypothetical protein